MLRAHVLKHLQEQDRTREEEAKEMSGATARGAIEKSRYVRVFEGEKVKGDDPVEYFLATGVRSTF